jgi:hypothetical protein
MRQELESIYGQRKRFFATFVRGGQKRGFRGRPSTFTLLFRDIRDASGRIVADHLWFNHTESFADDMVEGDVFSFDARVDEYLKGIDGCGHDYKLSRPTKVIFHGVPGAVDWDGPAFYTTPNVQTQ